VCWRMFASVTPPSPPGRTAAKLPWSDHPDAGAAWPEPTRGPLVGALTGDASVRAVVDGDTTLSNAAARLRAAAAAHLTAAADVIAYPDPPGAA
jgi:hypothetical protein